MHRKKINISIVLAGQMPGIKDVDEGIWLVFAEIPGANFGRLGG
jgi:hypothetical protein